MSCKNDCKTEALFPQTIFNRPALTHIQYRIGKYSLMREHMLDTLNLDEMLQGWSHRGVDDPGIALLECNALVGDILSFYQQLYANEAFIRSAQWRDSIAELVQMTGYRLTPGVAGAATFALRIKGDLAVSIPTGFGFKAQLAGREQQDEFESLQAITAYPALNEFNLYRPAKAMQSIKKGENKLELYQVEGASDLASREDVDIRPGERIMLLPDSSMFDDDGVPYADQERAEILIVKSVETILNRIVIYFEGKLTVNRGNMVRAFRIDRTFRHFGYSAPSQLSHYDGEEVTVSATSFERKINTTHSGSAFYSSLKKEELPLDQEVNDLAAGGKIIVQGLATEFEDNTQSPNVTHYDENFSVVREIDEIYVENLVWGNRESAVTVVKITERILENEDVYYEKMDIRKCRLHEVTSTELSLAAVTEFNDGAFTGNQLDYYGYYHQVKALAKHRLMLRDAADASIQALTTTSTLSDFAGQLSSRDERNPWLWSISLDEYPQYPQQAFDQLEPQILAYGNLVDCNQGKTEDEVILGNGDHRQSFQTFALPKAPLCYVLDEAQLPELVVYVENILWARVDSFFNSASDDLVYVVREDDDQNSYIQFGDGVHGARLPSGIKNVSAVYRTGVAAVGRLEAGAKPSASGKLSELEQVFLHGEVTGGDEAESGDNARVTAPARMQSLGRMVGIADYTTEARTIPGVLKVRAYWSAPDGTPSLSLVVLTESGTAAAIAKVQQTINGYNRCRGAARFPVIVMQGNLQYIYLKLRVGYQATRRKHDIDTALRLALGLIGEEDNGITSDSGLFSIKQREFAQGTHRSQILAAMQQVEGVSWVEIDDAQLLELGDPVETDALNLIKPVVVSTDIKIVCPPNRILALHSAQLDLSLIMDDSLKECES